MGWDYYGHTKEMLEEKLSSVLEMAGEIHLDPVILDGWSTVNLLGYVDGIPSFVLKIPRSMGNRDLERLYYLHNAISKHDLCPRPLFYGVLSKEYGLSMLVLEYINGLVYESPFEITLEDSHILRNSLSRLSAITLHSIPIYRDAHGFLMEIASSLDDIIQNHDCAFSDTLMGTVMEFCRLVQRSVMVSGTEHWNPVTSHGDLSEKNVLFQKHRAILIDLEDCCGISRYYDWAYLFVQHPSSTLQGLMSKKAEGCSTEHWRWMIVLGLCSVIKWSIQILCDIETKQLAPVLLGRLQKRLILDYVNSKLKLFEDFLSFWL